jgi:energy-coupling factor transporter ATP-binding protein EcfA2
MADLICRWRNGTPKTVVELVNSLPHSIMPNEAFRASMADKWNGDFFHTPYQLACQLGLYCEAEDGYYYPRFDHDITETEAEKYLEMWMARYYVPNPYTGSDGFKDLTTPTYVVKSLYDYVAAHPGCSYEQAYKAVFHDEAKNNDDIIRNYLNRYSKVLKFNKDGILSLTEISAQEIFSFMEKNNKKAFFDNFSDVKGDSLMEQYSNADNTTRQRMFYDFLISLGLADSSCRQYAYTHSVNDDVMEVVKDKSGKNTLFEVVDILMVSQIYSAVRELETNKKRNNALSATISNYRKFLDYLEEGKVSEVKGTAMPIETVDFSISSIISLIAETGLQYDPLLVKRFAFSLMTKPFVILSGLAGSGKTQLALAFAKAFIEDSSQMCTVSVGADWTNREPLLGYPNALDSTKYVRPESGVLDLLIEANKPANARKPYFLILDEMNMSYVERYFADFLSAMESHEAIKLWNGAEEDSVPASVKLPKNLFIIGTINVDETTYMFSPKVLDRANVIEFKIAGSEMEDFLGNIRSIDRNSICGRAAGMAESFLDKASGAEITPDETTRDTLIRFFNQLKTVNAEFGYRSASEIYRYIDIARKNDDTPDDNTILDCAMVQKLLPKLHGSRKKLVPVLKALWGFCCSGINLDDAGSVPENAEYPLTADKVLRMYRSAIDNGFTSYSEA